MSERVIEYKLEGPIEKGLITVESAVHSDCLDSKNKSVVDIGIIPS